MNTQCARLVELLRDRRGLDFSGYRSSAFERRCRSRAEKLGFQDLGDYVSHVTSHPEEVDALLDALTINVTSFFRDPWVFELLAERILPGVVHEKVRRGERLFRAWSAGCATGEEAYSLAMMLMEHADMECLVLGTDLDVKALDAARKAFYDEGCVLNVRLGTLKKYFEAVEGGYRVGERVRRRVTFAVHDLCDEHRLVPSEAVFGDFDLVSCRNVLIYYEKEAQEKIAAKLHRALMPGGLLVLGEVETVPSPFSRYFLRFTTWCPIYMKVV
ncbi:chemotaxis protein methyltransferase CheR [Desulfacinum infernum DSM 9756]|uniref:protein-glutamate O-methyltransferase n=1 Tax=Desulfacinum infernum DSM 9756 TaxID=1121391 RepID=A0A1M5DYF9_9BACT|nr:protein-glutamate O-methyltransferase CheR [Desulfacinum infernum]SHF71999.1 chemotaxis protein methyltransferase CheR [Desulfacinum infernum DSM 9756]